LRNYLSLLTFTFYFLLFTFCSDFMTILGIDIGGTKTAVVEGTFDGEILQREAIPTEGHRPFEESFSRIIELANKTITTAKENERDIRAISLSCPGPLKIEEGIFIDPPNLSGWHGARFKDYLIEKFSLPVYVEHDGNAGALAEFYFGAGRGRENLRHLIFLTCGTGMGAGIIVNGQILRGATDTAGEVGHIRLAEDGPKMFGKAGSWEGFAAGAGMVKLAVERFPNRFDKEMPIRDLIDAAMRDEPEALAVIAEAGRMTGRGMALLVDILNPQLIVLGALGVVLGERFTKYAREELDKEALPQAAAAVEIVPAILGKQIGDVASLMAAIVAHKSKN
jgi:glucokinase